MMQFNGSLVCGNELKPYSYLSLGQRRVLFNVMGEQEQDTQLRHGKKKNGEAWKMLAERLALSDSLMTAALLTISG